MHYINIFVGIALVYPQLSYTSLSRLRVGANLTEFMKLNRQRRTLIYNGSGSVKIDAGAISGIDLGDPIAWRNLVCINNIQGGFYPVPSTPLYPWDKWEDTFARFSRHSRSDVDYIADDSRKLVYNVLEILMERQHGAGHICLLRSICQNAQVDEHIGMFSEIMDVVLSPGKEDIDITYNEASLAGKAGADCLHLYAGCRVGTNLLDQYLDYV
ncbi:uncharacterized protein [Eurosta solidaginis]|uniref:uncharacterized protein n=1 Tax=Eurosta solidaginis TaxID=178769 RepID=UPI0035309855